MSILTRATKKFTFRNYHNDAAYLWFVAAQKQWGYNSSSFAISFTNTCWFVIPAFNGNGDNYYGFNITGKSKTNFTYNRHGGVTGTISYIAAGY